MDDGKRKTPGCAVTTPLACRLKRQIQLAGPITVADYMAACLFDPDYGYYTTRQPFGSDGDFITAPEISQIFGELVAIWVIHLWMERGEPAPFCLAEIGPGRGTLMSDMLRIFRSLRPDMLQAASIHMIEASPKLATVQKDRLAGEPIRWAGEISQLPEQPLILVGNELFDAIPARQYVRTGSAWHERMVGLDQEGNLCFLAGPGSLDPALLPPGKAEKAEGAIFEIAPAREAMAQSIAAHVMRCGGAALLFDYGHLMPGYGDTLQAVREHRHEDPLASPGHADLTSHVDFHALAKACAVAGAEAAFLEQGEFLRMMGLRERVNRLAAGLPLSRAQAVREAAMRLASPEGMGVLFKAMSIHPPGLEPYPFAMPGERN